MTTIHYHRLLSVSRIFAQLNNLCLENTVLVALPQLGGQLVAHLPGVLLALELDAR
jgi:hypothetical protein